MRHLGTREYSGVWRDMQAFTNQRGLTTEDEIWLVEHQAVFTLGLNGKRDHILNAGSIPIVNCDRGGQVTYHGPGQIVAYVLLDLRRRNLGVKNLVQLLEQAVINVLANLGIEAQRQKNAPGVYVNGAKIAALGLRVRKGCSYHGLSLNVDMDLEPFSRINPCGYAGLQSTQVRDLIPQTDKKQLENQLLAQLQQLLQPKPGV
ncbi:lipoyl(octanoyl) transferase LipB [Kaarinaea lacus]